MTTDEGNISDRLVAAIRAAIRRNPTVTACVAAAYASVRAGEWREAERYADEAADALLAEHPGLASPFVIGAIVGAEVWQMLGRREAN